MSGRVIAVAEFRSALRHFLRRSEKIARQSGLTPQRYTLLMMIKGAPDGERAVDRDRAVRADAARAEHGDRARAPRRERGADRARAVPAGRARRPPASDHGGRASPDALVHRARDGTRSSYARRSRTSTAGSRGTEQVPAGARDENAGVGAGERLGARSAVSLAAGEVEVGRRARAAPPPGARGRARARSPRRAPAAPRR